MKFFPACSLWALSFVLSGCATGPRGALGGSAGRSLAQGPMVESARYGYRLALRDTGWRPIRASALSPLADVALEHDGGDALVLIFAERTAERRLDDFVRKSRGYARLVAGAGSSWTSAETTRVAAPGALAPAWLVEREVDRWQLLRYYTLVTLIDGVGYNVLCWGSARNRTLSALCRGLLAGFHIGGPGPSERSGLDFLSLVPESKR